MSHQISENRLFVRIGRSWDQPIFWFDETAEKEQEIHRLANIDSLSVLSEQPGAQNICIFIPASDVIFRQVPLPSRPGKNLGQMISYLTEESIASDVDSLHWVELFRQEQTLFVAGIEEKLLQLWLQPFTEAGLTVRQVYVDALLLPLPDEGWAIARIENQWLIRQSAYSGCLIEDELLPALLTVANPSKLLGYGMADQSLPRWVEVPLDSPLLLMMKNHCHAAVNFLQGTYAVRKAEPLWFKRLPALALYIVIFTLSLAICAKGFTFWLVSREDTQLIAQTQALYSGSFPQDKHTRNLRFYFEQNMKKAPKPFLSLLGKLTAYQAKVPNLNMEKVEFEQQEKKLTLHITADNRATIDQFISLSAADFQFKVSQLLPSPTGLTATLTSRSKS